MFCSRLNEKYGVTSSEHGEECMKRREFLAASGLTATAALLQDVDAAAMPSGDQQYLELRHYEFASAEKQQSFDVFLANAVIPALNRQGIKPVGVFNDAGEKGEAGLRVLIPHPSLESVITSNTKMLADSLFVQAGGEISIARRTIRPIRVLTALCCWLLINVLTWKSPPGKIPGYFNCAFMKAITRSWQNAKLRCSTRAVKSTCSEERA